MPTTALKVLLSPDGSQAYVVCNNAGSSGSIAIVSLSSMKVTGVITTTNARYPLDIAVSPDGSTLYVSALGAAQGLAEEAIPAAPVHGKYPPAMGVCAFDTATLALKGFGKGFTGYLAVSQDGKSVYAT